MDISYTQTKEEITPQKLDGVTLAVVIDVCMFSSTVITLFDRGVDEINVFTDETEVEYKFGGEYNSDSDFSNYPQSVYGNVRENDNIVGITSDNGAIACHNIIEADPTTEIAIASTLNAKSIANYIEKSSYDKVLLLQSGRRGTYQFEDSIASAMIGELLRGRELTDREFYKENIQKIVKKYYSWVPSEDIKRLTEFNAYNVVPLSEEYSKEFIKFTTR